MSRLRERYEFSLWEPCGISAPDVDRLTVAQLYRACDIADQFYRQRAER